MHQEAVRKEKKKPVSLYLRNEPYSAAEKTTGNQGGVQQEAATRKAKERGTDKGQTSGQAARCDPSLQARERLQQQEDVRTLGRQRIYRPEVGIGVPIRKLGSA